MIIFAFPSNKAFNANDYFDSFNANDCNDGFFNHTGLPPKAPPLTVQPTLGGLAPMLNISKPFGSFVRNLNDSVPVFTASHFGRICETKI